MCSSDLTEAQIERLRYELHVVEETGFVEYMLIVRDIAQFARSRKIPMGVRGSAAASIILYCLDVTDIEPTQYRLVFERFLNLERREMPDVDFDFADERRPWIVVVFSSASCHTCADVVRKAAVLESPEVGVIDVEWGARRDLHRKYSIDAVPVIAIADADGVVRRGFTGPVTATDLWAAVADARQPGSSPEPELGN